jgi:hypothetical protein
MSKKMVQFTGYMKVAFQCAHCTGWLGGTDDCPMCQDYRARIGEPMKLIQKGNDPKDRIWRGTCGKCKSKFEATQRELDITHDQRDGDFAHADCSECKAKAPAAVVMYPPEGAKH